jgi:hypothetical protein
MGKTCATITSVAAFTWLYTLGASLAFAAPIRSSVLVECGGNCANVTLQQACNVIDQGSIPVAVSCNDPTTGQGSNASCGSGTCRAFGVIFGSDHVSDYCGDTNGFDALVTCGHSGDAPASPSARRVECNGHCETVSLGQVCSGAGSPVAIACDTVVAGVASPQPCGVGGAQCKGHMSFLPSNGVGEWCKDTSSWDAVVTCAP